MLERFPQANKKKSDEKSKDEIVEEQITHNFDQGDTISNQEKEHDIKKYNVTEIKELLNDAEKIFSKENNLLYIKKGKEKNIIFIGDIHGDLKSLKLIFEKYNIENNKFIFLGDYVDRGTYSIDCINYLLEKKIKHPINVALLRGNHESPLVNYNYGFYIDLRNTFDKSSMELFFRYNEVFSSLPYAAQINKYNVLCLHGGLSENILYIEELNTLPKKDLIPTTNKLFETLWNDPREGISDWGFLNNSDGRGPGTFLFSEKITLDFLKNNDLQALIRGHEYYKEGYKFHFRKKNNINNFSGSVLTVFTCREYEGVTPSIAVLNDDGLTLQSLI